MNQKEAIEKVRKNNWKHKQCCYTAQSDKRNYCCYFKKFVDPDSLGCTMFNTCDECKNN